MTKWEIGEKIASLRRARHLSQMAFAEKIDVSVKTVSKIENGIEHMRIDTLIKICSVLETTPNHLLGYKSDDRKTVEKMKQLVKELLVIAGD